MVRVIGFEPFEGQWQGQVPCSSVLQWVPLENKDTLLSNKDTAVGPRNSTQLWGVTSVSLIVPIINILYSFSSFFLPNQDPIRDYKPLLVVMSF